MLKKTPFTSTRIEALLSRAAALDLMLFPIYAQRRRASFTIRRIDRYDWTRKMRFLERPRPPVRGIISDRQRQELYGKPQPD